MEPFLKRCRISRDQLTKEIAMGIIVSITGVSGAGKTTLAREVLARMENASMVESVTTRLRRPSDIKGEYRYVSLELFGRLEKMNSFLWTAEHVGTRYGTIGESIFRFLKEITLLALWFLCHKSSSVSAHF